MSRHADAGKPAFSAGRSYPSYRRIARMLKAAPFTVAAPSFVVPDTVAANCRFLDGLFPEVALCLFETAACRDYGDDDLPPDPAALDLDFHAHLPLDLPWTDGPGAAARAALAVARRVAHLAPRCFVLHPPGTPEELEGFARVWTRGGHAPEDLLLENIESNDLAALLGAARELGLSLCLDLGHMMAYEQQFLIQTVDWRHVRMLHVNAPGDGSRHRPLTELDEGGRVLLGRMLDRLRPDGVVTLEVFEERGLMRSAELLVQWMTEWNPA